MKKIRIWSLGIALAFVFVVSGEDAADDYVSIESTDGRIINAQIVSVSKESVNIRRKDGRSFAIPLSRLTPATISKINASQPVNPPDPNNDKNPGTDNSSNNLAGSWLSTDKKTISITFEIGGVAKVITSPPGVALLIEGYEYKVDSTRRIVTLLRDAKPVASGVLQSDGTLKVKGTFKNSDIDAVLHREIDSQSNGDHPGERPGPDNVSTPSVSPEVEALRKAVFEKGGTYFLACKSPTPVKTHRMEGNAAGFGNNAGKAVFMSFPSLAINFQCDTNPSKPSEAFCARLILQVSDSRTRLKSTHKPVITSVLTLNNGEFHASWDVWGAMKQQGNGIAFVSLIPASQAGNPQAAQISNTVQVPVIVTTPQR